MSFDDIIAVVAPEADSHFRLRGCRSCGSDHAAYVQLKDGRWTVWCFDCLHKGEPAQTRHGAQVVWNKEGAA